MRKSRLVISDAATADLVEQADWYLTQSGRPLAERWENAVTSAITRVVSRPTLGTPCKFHSRELHTLRRANIPGFRKTSTLLYLRFRPIFAVRPR